MTLAGSDASDRFKNMVECNCSEQSDFAFKI